MESISQSRHFLAGCGCLSNATSRRSCPLPEHFFETRPIGEIFELQSKVADDAYISVRPGSGSSTPMDGCVTSHNFTTFYLPQKQEALDFFLNAVVDPEFLEYVGNQTPR